MYRPSCIFLKLSFSDFKQFLFSVSIPNARQPLGSHFSDDGFNFISNVEKISDPFPFTENVPLTVSHTHTSDNTTVPVANFRLPNNSECMRISTQTVHQSLQRIYPPCPIVYLGIVQRHAGEQVKSTTANVLHPRLDATTTKTEVHDDHKYDGGYSCGTGRQCNAVRCEDGDEDVWVLRQGSCFGASRPPFVVFPILPRYCKHDLGRSLQSQILSSLSFTDTNEPVSQESTPMSLLNESSPVRKISLCLSNSLRTNEAKGVAESDLEEPADTDVYFFPDLLQCILSPVVRNSLNPYSKGVLTHAGVNPIKVDNRSEEGGEGTSCARQHFNVPISESSITPASYVDIRQGKFAVNAQQLWELAMINLRQRAPCLVLVDEREPVSIPDSGLGVKVDARGLCIDDRRLDKPLRRVRFQVEPKSWKWDHNAETDRGVLPVVSLPTASFDVAVYTERMLLPSLTLHSASDSALLSGLSKSQRRMEESRRLHIVDAGANASLNTEMHNTENVTTTFPKGSTHTAWVWNGNFWSEEADPQLSRVAHSIFSQLQNDRSSRDIIANNNHIAPPVTTQQPVAWIPSFWWDFRTQHSKPCFLHTHRMGGVSTHPDPLPQFTIELRKTWTVTGLEGIYQLLLMSSMRLKLILEERDSHRLAPADGDHDTCKAVMDSEKPHHDTKLHRRYTKRMRAAEKTLTVASLLSSTISPPPSSQAEISFDNSHKSSAPLDNSHGEPGEALEVEMCGSTSFIEPADAHPHLDGYYLFNSSGEGLSKVRYPAYDALTGVPLPYNKQTSRCASGKKLDVCGDVSKIAQSSCIDSTRLLHSSEFAEARSLKSSPGCPTPFEYSFASQQICWMPRNAVEDVGLKIARDAPDIEKDTLEQPRVQALMDPGEPPTDATAALNHEVHYTGFPFHELPPWIMSLIPSSDISETYPKVVLDASTGTGPLVGSASKEMLLRTLLEHVPSPTSGCIQWHCSSSRKVQMEGCGDATVWVLQLDPTHCRSHVRDPELSVFSPVRGLLWRVYRVADTKVNFIFSMSDVLQSVDAEEGKRHPRDSVCDCYSLEKEVNLIRRLLHSVFEARCHTQRRSYDTLRLSGELETASYFFLDVRAALLLLEILKARKRSLHCFAWTHFINKEHMSSGGEGADHTDARRGCGRINMDVKAPLGRTSNQDWLEECEAIWSEYSSSQACRKEGLIYTGACSNTTSPENTLSRWFLSPSSFVDCFIARCKKRIFWKLAELDTVLSLADPDEIAQGGEKKEFGVDEGGLHPDSTEEQSTTALPSGEKAMEEVCTDNRDGPLSQTPLSPQEEAFLAQFEILRDDDDTERVDVPEDAIHPFAKDLATLGDFPAVDHRCYGPGARLYEALIHPKLPADGGVKRLAPSTLGSARIDAILHANKVARCMRRHSPYTDSSQDHSNDGENIPRGYGRGAFREESTDMLSVNMGFLPIVEDVGEAAHKSTPAGRGVSANTVSVETPSFSNIRVPRLTCANQVKTCIAEEEHRLRKRWSPWLRLLSKGIPKQNSGDSDKSNGSHEIPLSVPPSPLGRMLCTLEEAKPLKARSLEACEKFVRDKERSSMEKMIPTEIHQNGLLDGLCCWDLGLKVISISYSEHYVNASNLPFSF
ncbi:unnamed protein product [Phytomonas sp. EM1]|nr:unnamed protein product [Phytomonas sp. EM1]|eukprot:CCW61246.1 unnamed protein product [Phytomonas sp. isolate EM1]